jgi:hypothetical protein
VTYRALAGIICLCIGAALLIAANRCFYAILAEVNKLRSDDDRISNWEVRIEMNQILISHADSYPDSPKRREMWAFALMAFLFINAGLAVLILH